MYHMAIQSKVTSQGQISVPAEIRKKLGVSAGSVLEWREEGERVEIRRAGRYSSEDVHAALFPKAAAKPRTLTEIKARVQQHLKAKHARR
jgi:AbrB family looped-hinge helix DNA binding protein